MYAFVLELVKEVKTMQISRCNRLLYDMPGYAFDASALKTPADQAG